MASNTDYTNTYAPLQSFHRYELKSSKKRESTFPIPFPKTPDEVKALLKSPDHKARDLISRSLKAHRNPYEAMIFLYGLSGAGKSTTLNHLFNTKLIPTSDSKSSTTDVIEYVATMDSIRWDVTGLNIGFIDTPGWGDTSGSGINDLANIEHFLVCHPYLDSQYLHLKFYPNIVMIVVRAGDPRITGFNSQLSKMLRVLSKLNIVDKICPNVIIVLTCALFIRPPKKYVEKRDNQIQIIKNLVRLHLGVDPPVIVIENLAEEEELEKVGDWTLLPDGSKQPLNLFDAMITLMKLSGDEIGVEAVRLIFSQGNSIQICDKRQIPSEDGIFKDIQSAPDPEKWAKIIAEEFTILKETEVYKTILYCLEEKSLPKLSSLTYESVQPLLHKLQEMNLSNVVDLSCRNIEEINRLLHPFKLTRIERILLFELFKVRPLENLKDIDLLGCGYLALDNLRIPIISSKVLKYCYEIGTHVPEISTFTSKGRLLVHCRCEWVKENIFSTRKAVVSFAVQYELFSLTISSKQLTFEQMENSFIKAVSCLPNDVFDHSDKKITDAYKFFIDKYGTQCVMGVSYGGEINGSINLPESITEFSGDTYQITLLLKIFFENIQKGSNLTRLDYGAIIDENSMSMFENICELPITWKGGEEKFHASSLKNLSPIFWSCWVDSLCMKFVPLHKIIQFIPMQNIIAIIHSEKYNSITKAIQEHQHVVGKDNHILHISENPDRHEWDFVESKQIPKDYRKWATDNAVTKDGKFSCSIL
ncbi:hypothetical protein LOD99_14043 [Oopsacas minuta]|uniref:Uncharacterized protein n=1 Tax=Oopsacas minuta TaxID=111878 RepID=A0AAV7KHV0_9METZ|nr:hypothetical protein LOD99_14043 [Oopsacas minuta]